MFPADVTEAIKRHARSVFPEESCGFVVEREGKPYYQGFANLAAQFGKDPTKAFKIDDIEWTRNGKVLAVVHSHPYAYAGRPGTEVDGPSESDMDSQIDCAVPFGIVALNEFDCQEPYYWGDMLTPPKLTDRPFRHGPSGTDGRGDCYALIRDYYRMEKGILLREWPRSWEWWKEDNGGHDFYRDKFRATGFIAITQREAREGDVFLACLRSRITNHGGIYLGRGNALHHTQNDFSQEVVIGAWGNLITNWLRYVGPDAVGV